MVSISSRVASFRATGVVGVDEGIAQVVVLIGELDGGLVEHDALLHAIALGEVSRRRCCG